MGNKPRIVKAKITRTVTEIGIIKLDRYGNVDDIDDILDELDYEVIDYEIQEIRGVHP